MHTNEGGERRVVTTYDLKEVLKAKTEAERTDIERRRGENLSRGELPHSGWSRLKTQPGGKKTQQKKNKNKLNATTLPESYFLFVSDLAAFQEESLLGCRVRTTVMLL